jgi:hypothetical protein
MILSVRFWLFAVVVFVSVSNTRIMNQMLGLAAQPQPPPTSLQQPPPSKQHQETLVLPRSTQLTTDVIDTPHNKQQKQPSQKRNSDNGHHNGVYEFPDWTDMIDEYSSKIGCHSYTDDGIQSEDDSAYTNIPTEATWNAYYEAYLAVMDPKVSSFATHHHHHQRHQPDAWFVPIEVRYEPIKGRGVYAKEFIPKGTVVWTPDKNTAEFPTKDDYRRFLDYLWTHFNDRPDLNRKQLVCDAFMWLDQIKASPAENHYTSCMGFDESSMINTVKPGNLRPNWSTNLSMTPDSGYGCQEGKLMTKRDIQPGEELRISYDRYSGRWHLDKKAAKLQTQ